MPGFIQYNYFDKALELGKDKCLEKLKKEFEHRSIDDIHASMSWWACFNEESKAFSSSTGYSEQPSSKALRNNKKAKKKKRKQKKASKKINRR